MCSQLVVVGSGMAVESIGPGIWHYLDEIVVPLYVLGKQNQVPAYVTLVGMAVHIGIGNIGLTSKYGLKDFRLLLFY